jgi:hypothetical protein
MNRVLVFVLAAAIANGQSTTAVVSGGGATAPRFLSAVPGELFTLFLAGLDPEVSVPFFTKEPPLPFEVNGLTIAISHAEIFPGDPGPTDSVAWQDYAVGIHSIRQVGALTAITVQVPPEIETRRLPSGDPTYLNGPFNGAIRILRGDTVIANADLMIWSQRIRVVTSCDFAYRFDETTKANAYCAPLVFRQDGSSDWGTLVSQRERISVLITGLGTLLQPGIRELFKTGWPNPDPPVPGGMSYLRDIGINLGPHQPWRNRTTSGPQPPMLSAPGFFVPGEYGISRVEIEMPELRPSLDPECPGSVALYSSNVTVTIGNSTSYDYVRFCVMGSTVPPADAVQNLRKIDSGAGK